MTTDIWTDRLSEYVDGELTASEVTAVEEHLKGCAACRDIVHDLRAVARRAASLPEDVPAHDLWPAIGRAIGAETPVLVLRPRRAWLGTLPRLAAAAVLVAVLSGGSVWLAMRRSTSVTPVAVAPAPAAFVGPARLTPASMRAERTYDAAVADLRAVLDSGRGRLDSTTVRVLERNLAIVDSAVADARRAVAADPNSVYLNTYLARTMRQKLDLLREAARLARAET